MNPKTAALFNDDILAAAMKRYDIARDQIKLLDGFESFIYEFKRPDGDFILRLSHSSRRTPDMIRGEVDWINSLARSGVSVARAVCSKNNTLVEGVEDGQGGQFLATAFTKAPGGVARQDQRNERFFINYGRLLGRMHAIARTYAPGQPEWRRYEWDNPVNNPSERHQSLIGDLPLAKYQDLFDELLTLPRDAGGYGMIHQDAHLGNLFVDEDYTLTLFDFDDCVYGHFIYDIAMVLFYIVPWEPQAAAAYTAGFMPVFLEGYRENNRLDAKWLKEIPHFLKLREIDLYGAILHDMGETPVDSWCARYLRGRRERIEQDVPFIEYDWDSLSRYV